MLARDVHTSTVVIRDTIVSSPLKHNYAVQPQPVSHARSSGSDAKHPSFFNAREI